MSEARRALLDKVVAHAAAHGLSDVSLRQLASDIGTSHRMLIYHFGSRDGLVAAVVTEVEERQRLAMQELASHATTLPDLVRAMWEQVSDPALRPFVRLFLEVVALASQGRPGTDGFLDRLTEPWLAKGRQAAANVGLDPPVADLRLGLAVMRGLLIDVLATGDDNAATESLERFIAMWERDTT